MRALNMKFVKLEIFTITKRPMLPGGSEIGFNVDKNGVPFAYIWSFRNTPGTRNFWNAKLVNSNATFTAGTSYEEAEAWVRGQ